MTLATSCGPTNIATSIIQDRLDTETIVWDNGIRWETDYDQANQHGWAKGLQAYNNATGELLQQQLHMDDGSVFIV